MDNRQIRFVAHRGESFLAPENTMAAFNLAWSLGDEAVETDIRLTRDGQVVICHDADTFRISGNRRKVVIKDSTLAEIQSVDVGSFKDQRFADERCPALRDLYATLPPGKAVYTEIKSGLDVVPAFADVVRQFKLTPAQLVVISFHADALAASKKLLPEFKHHYLANHEKDAATGQYRPAPNVNDWIATTRQIRADGLDLCAFDPLGEPACRAVLSAGLELHLWTIDDPAIARRYLQWGAHSITTNRAHWMRERLSDVSAT